MEETVAVEHTLLNHTLEVVLQCLSDAKDFGQRLRDSEARLVQAKEESREPELLLRLHELEKAKITADREQAAMSREIQRRRQELNQTRQWFDTETRRLLVEMEFHIASRLLEIKKENQQLLSRLERYRSQNRELKEAVNQEGPHKELISRLEREKQSEVSVNPRIGGSKQTDSSCRWQPTALSATLSKPWKSNYSKHYFPPSTNTAVPECWFRTSRPRMLICKAKDTARRAGAEGQSSTFRKGNQRCPRVRLAFTMIQHPRALL